MVTIPVSNPVRARVVTALAGLGVAAAAYYLPTWLPGFAAAAPIIPKTLWALGLTLFGVGGGTVVQAPS